MNQPGVDQQDGVIINDDLKLIRLNSCGIREPDDESYPYKLVVNLSPPQLMNIAFVMLYGGSEEMIVRGKTREAIGQFLERNDLRQHPRLRWMTIEGPDGSVEKTSR